MSIPASAPTVHVRAHVSYVEGHSHRRNCVDFYLPAQSMQTTFPLLLFVHGGALMMGDKQVAQHVGLGFARQGIGVIAPNHRLSPKVAHPAHVQDVARALAFSLNFLKAHGADTTRIAVAGHSSGAYLAALLVSDRRYLAAEGLNVEQIAACVPISGFFHVDRVAPERPKHVWGTEQRDWLEASPTRHVHPEIPPTLLLYADGDTSERRQESIDFNIALRAHGVTCDAMQISGRDHRSIFFQLFSREDQATAHMSAFLRRHLRPVE